MCIRYCRYGDRRGGLIGCDMKISGGCDDGSGRICTGKGPRYGAIVEPVSVNDGLQIDVAAFDGIRCFRCYSYGRNARE